MTTDALTLPPEELKAPRTAGLKWSLTKRVGFRFACCYWLLYCLPEKGRQSLTGLIPGAYYLNRPYVGLWHKFTPWVAQHFFHLSGTRITYFPTGSGDTTLDYIQNFLFIVIALLGTLVWSLLDRKREQYGTLYVWLRILLRFTLAITLLQYGLAKIVPLQFRPPNLSQLVEGYGESSPMHLLWTFMGESMPYTIFAGLAETTAAILLLFRRTALLGTLVAAGVLLNVVMLNFSYDVPVKLYSANLLLMALFLLLPDISRLANVFVFNRTAPPAELTRPHLSKRWMRVSAKAVTLALFAYFVASATWGGWQYFQRLKADGTPLIYGIYDVDALSLNGKPALLTDAAKPAWKQVIADYGSWVIQSTDGAQPVFAPHFEKGNTVYLYSWKTRSYLKLNYAQPDAQHLVLTGHFGGDNLEVRLHQTTQKQFLLTSRGFHWISEYPLNK
ncbi:MAG: hypothetical protein WAM66_12935 [Acidobacteriaceae bacterium]